MFVRRAALCIGLYSAPVLLRDHVISVTGSVQRSEALLPAVGIAATQQHSFQLMSACC